MKKDKLRAFAISLVMATFLACVPSTGFDDRTENYNQKNYSNTNTNYSNSNKCWICGGSGRFNSMRGETIQCSSCLGTGIYISNKKFRGNPKVPGTCFAAETLVLMADGSHKEIQEIKVGDFVLSFPEKEPLSKTLSPKMVKAVYKTSDIPLIKAGGVYTTLGHQFISESGKWTKIRYLKKAVNKDGHIKDIRQTKILRNATVYNLEVEDYHTYIVFGDDYWKVHNGRGGNTTVK